MNQKLNENKIKPIYLNGTQYQKRVSKQNMQEIAVCGSPFIAFSLFISFQFTFHFSEKINYYLMIEKNTCFHRSI